MRIQIQLFMCAACLLLVSCKSGGLPLGGGARMHPMQGGWLGADGTVFHFRKDNTFHGYDFRHREIWGNWVVLSDERIGFQSLLHDSYYNPQYAIVDEANSDEMDYIVTGGRHFIPARRISEEEAMIAINLVIENSLHAPDD